MLPLAHTTCVKGKVCFPLILKELSKNLAVSSRLPGSRPKARLVPRKEVIHRQVPLAMPCYDLLLIIDLTVAPAKAGSSGTINSSELTGGFGVIINLHLIRTTPPDERFSRILAVPITNRFAPSLAEAKYYERCRLLV